LRRTSKKNEIKRCKLVEVRRSRTRDLVKAKIWDAFQSGDLMGNQRVNWKPGNSSSGKKKVRNRLKKKRKGKSKQVKK